MRAESIKILAGAENSGIGLVLLFAQVRYVVHDMQRIIGVIQLVHRRVAYGSSQEPIFNDNEKDCIKAQRSSQLTGGASHSTLTLSGSTQCKQWSPPNDMNGSDPHQSLSAAPLTGLASQEPSFFLRFCSREDTDDVLRRWRAVGSYLCSDLRRL